LLFFVTEVSAGQDLDMEKEFDASSAMVGGNEEAHGSEDGCG